MPKHTCKHARTVQPQFKQFSSRVSFLLASFSYSEPLQRHYSAAAGHCKDEDSHSRNSRGAGINLLLNGPSSSSISSHHQPSPLSPPPSFPPVSSFWLFFIISDILHFHTGGPMPSPWFQALDLSRSTSSRFVLQTHIPSWDWGQPGTGSGQRSWRLETNPLGTLSWPFPSMLATHRCQGFCTCLHAACCMLQVAAHPPTFTHHMPRVTGQKWLTPLMVRPLA